MSEKIRNAKIASTRLGFDREVFQTASVRLDYGDSSGQYFGGRILCEPAKGEDPCRRATAYGADTIFRLLWAVGVDRWEDLKGTSVRVKYRGEGFSMKPYAIGHIIEDRWCDLDELARVHGIAGAPEVES